MRAKSALGGLGIVAVGVVSAGAVFVLHRALMSDRSPSYAATEPSDRPRDAEQRLDERENQLLARTDSVADETATNAGGQRAPDAPADNGSPHVEALRHPSPSYRNVSLLAAIRGAGHVCTDILSAGASADDLGVWRVSCEGARAYFVSEDGDGGLRVEPIVFRDGLVPGPFNQGEPPNLVPESPNDGPRLQFVPPPE